MARVPFQWQDPFLMNDQLSDQERMIKEAAHDYAQNRLQPRVTQAFRHETMDASIFREMGELGLLGPTIPTQYGGAGLSYVDYGLIAREVERVDSGYRSMMSVQSSLVMVPINAFGTEAQKEKYLPKLATGEWIGCFGLTEPDHGSVWLKPSLLPLNQECAPRAYPKPSWVLPLRSWSCYQRVLLRSGLLKPTACKAV